MLAFLRKARRSRLPQEDRAAFLLDLIKGPPWLWDLPIAEQIEAKITLEEIASYLGRLP